MTLKTERGWTFLQSQFNRSLEECAALQTGSAARFVIVKQSRQMI